METESMERAVQDRFAEYCNGHALKRAGAAKPRPPSAATPAQRCSPLTSSFRARSFRTRASSISAAFFARSSSISGVRAFSSRPLTVAKYSCRALSCSDERDRGAHGDREHGASSAG